MSGPDAQAAALADLVLAALGPPPPGAGKADRRTRQAAARRNSLKAARAQGCICEPDITYHAGDPVGWGVPFVSLAHDDWCPMVDAGRNLIAYHEPGPHPSRVGRNEPCPCGSGKKSKRCCGAGHPKQGDR